MGKKARRPNPPQIANERNAALAKLQRLYGRNSVREDVFGRRPALPSEIEKLGAGQRTSTVPKKGGR